MASPSCARPGAPGSGWSAAASARAGPAIQATCAKVDAAVDAAGADADARLAALWTRARVQSPWRMATPRCGISGRPCPWPGESGAWTRWPWWGSLMGQLLHARGNGDAVDVLNEAAGAWRAIGEPDEAEGLAGPVARSRRGLKRSADEVPASSGACYDRVTSVDQAHGLLRSPRVRAPSQRRRPGDAALHVEGATQRRAGARLRRGAQDRRRHWKRSWKRLLPLPAERRRRRRERSARRGRPATAAASGAASQAAAPAASRQRRGGCAPPDPPGRPSSGGHAPHRRSAASPSGRCAAGRRAEIAPAAAAFRAAAADAPSPRPRPSRWLP